MLPHQINVSRQQLENDLKLFEAKVELQKALLNTHIQKHVTERALVIGFLSQQGFAQPGTQGAGQLKEWRDAHLKAAKAQEDLIRVGLAELEAQVHIRKNMLEQADTKVKVPSKFQI